MALLHSNETAYKEGYQMRAGASYPSHSLFFLQKLEVCAGRAHL